MDDHNDNKSVTDSLIQQLIKAVTGFADTLGALKDTVASLKDIVLHDQKRHEDFSSRSQKQHEEFAANSQKRHETFVLEKQMKDEIFARETHQRYEDMVRQNRTEDAKQKLKAQKDAYIVTFISVFAICGSLIATGYWDFQGKKIDLKRVETAQIYNQENITQQRILYLQHEINDRLTLRNHLMLTMANLRGIRDIGQKQCVNGQYAGPNPIEYRQKLFAADYAYIGVLYETTGVFSDAVQKKLFEFSGLASVDYEDICAKNSTTDSQLRVLANEINTMILKSLHGLKDQKNTLVNSLSKDEDQSLKK